MRCQPFSLSIVLPVFALLLLGSKLTAEDRGAGDNSPRHRLPIYCSGVVDDAQRDSIQAIQTEIAAEREALQEKISLLDQQLNQRIEMVLTPEQKREIAARRSGKRVPVSSSALKSVGYHEAKEILEVEFHKFGDVYRYFGVPKNAYRRLMQAKSKGRFFNRRIRNREYEFSKVGGLDAQNVDTTVRPNVSLLSIGETQRTDGMLTAAIHAVQAHRGLAEQAAEDERRGIIRDATKTVTISIGHVQYQSENRRYDHFDFGSHKDVVKNLIASATQIDGAILVVSAANGITAETREQLHIATKVGVPGIVVFVVENDVAVDDASSKNFETDLQRLLAETTFSGQKVPIIRGSVSRAQRQVADPQATKCIRNLIDAIDRHIPAPKRDQDYPFLMAIEDVFSIQGRGTVATGRIETGDIRPNDEVEIVGMQAEPKKTICTGVEMFGKDMKEGRAGDNVGCVLRGIKAGELTRGQVLATPGSIDAHTRFEAQIYCLSKEEGGRHTPFFSGYRPQFYFRTTDVIGTTQLLGAEMCMPGDTVGLSVVLHKPVAMQRGVRFAIREGGRTVGIGVVTAILRDS